MTRNGTEGRIFQLNCSQGGVPKLPVIEALLTPTGLVCDRQEHTRFHGGVQRALCLYAIELIRELQAEGHPIAPGTTGENVTIEHLDWSLLKPGSRLALGTEVLIEISSYTVPCKQIAASFTGGAFNRIAQTKHPGNARLYARVLRTGVLRAGEVVRVLD
ncbi:MAG: MOSC domain-containing protein [Pyrinomonadaceae bacterium]